MKPKHFHNSFKAKANLRSSSKLIKYILQAKKKKWEVISKPLEIFSLLPSNDSHPNDFQACSDSFINSWKSKQNFQEHFLVQKQSHYRRFARKAKKNASSSLFQSHSNLPGHKLSFLLFWESRLDVLLWKSRLLSSLAQSRQLILQGFVSVNSKTSTHPNQLLEEGDFVSLNLPQKLYQDLLQTFKATHFGLLPPFYIEAHYSSLSFIFVHKPSISQLSYSFNLKAILKDLQLLFFYFPKKTIV
jgi:ribosomal protein S4